MFHPYDNMHSYASVGASTQQPSQQSQFTNASIPVQRHGEESSSPTKVVCVLHTRQLSQDGKMLVQRIETRPDGKQHTTSFYVAPHDMQQFVHQQKQHNPHTEFVKQEQNTPQVSPSQGAYANTNTHPSSLDVSSSVGLSAYDKFDSTYSTCFFQQAQVPPQSYSNTHTDSYGHSPQPTDGNGNVNC